MAGLFVHLLKGGFVTSGNRISIFTSNQKKKKKSPQIIVGQRQAAAEFTLHKDAIVGLQQTHSSSWVYLHLNVPACSPTAALELHFPLEKKTLYCTVKWSLWGKMKQTAGCVLHSWISKKMLHVIIESQKYRSLFKLSQRSEIKPGSAVVIMGAQLLPAAYSNTLAFIFP